MPQLTQCSFLNVLSSKNFPCNFFKLNTESLEASHNYNPAVTSLHDGKVVIASQRPSDKDIGDLTVYTQIFNVDGSKFNDEITVAGKVDFARNPAIATLSNGNFIITETVWDRSFGSSANSQTVGDIFSSDGTKSTKFVVSRSGYGFEEFSKIIGLNIGNFASVARAQSTTGSQVCWMMLYSNDLTKTLGSQAVSGNIGNGFIYPDISELSNGNLVISYQGDYLLYARVASSVGTNFITNSIQVSDSKDQVYHSDIEGLGNGKFIAVWSIYLKGDIYAQMFYNNGTKFQDQFTIHTGEGYSKPLVKKLDAEKFVVAWDHYEQFEYLDMYAQVFNNDGTKVGSPIQINDDGYGNHNLDINIGRNGELIAVWDHDNQHQDVLSGIHAKVFTFDLHNVL